MRPERSVFIMSSIKHLPGSERPREKLLQTGAQGLSNTELIALIVSNGTRDQSALEVSSEILALEPDGLRGLANCQPEEFMRVKGVGEALACKLCAAIELGRRISYCVSENKTVMDRPDAAADVFMKDLRHLQKEKICLAMLNANGEIVAREEVASGGISSACVSPREVFSNAVRKGAYAVVLAHNHPSGDPTPSAEDISLTKRIAQAGSLLGIKLEDHIIIGDGRYISLREMGII